MDPADEGGGERHAPRTADTTVAIAKSTRPVPSPRGPRARPRARPRRRATARTGRGRRPTRADAERTRPRRCRIRIGSEAHHEADARCPRTARRSWSRRLRARAWRRRPVIWAAAMKNSSASADEQQDAGTRAGRRRGRREDHDQRASWPGPGRLQEVRGSDEATSTGSGIGKCRSRVRSWALARGRGRSAIGDSIQMMPITVATIESAGRSSSGAARPGCARPEGQEAPESRDTNRRPGTATSDDRPTRARGPQHGPRRSSLPAQRRRGRSADPREVLPPHVGGDELQEDVLQARVLAHLALARGSRRACPGPRSRPRSMIATSSHSRSTTCEHVGREEERHALVGQAAQEVRDHAAGDGIDAVEGLVEEEHARGCG